MAPTSLIAISQVNALASNIDCTGFVSSHLSSVRLGIHGPRTVGSPPRGRGSDRIFWFAELSLPAISVPQPQKRSALGIRIAGSGLDTSTDAMDEMFFDGWQSLLRTLVIGVLAYAALVGILRISGNRTLSKLNAFDFIVTVASAPPWRLFC